MNRFKPTLLRIPGIVWFAWTLLSLPILGGPLALGSEPTVSIGRADAHEYMQQGDQARDRRQWADAIRSYQAALDMFRMLGGEAPRWEQDYFNFRMQYCAREIRLIERRTGRPAAVWLETESALTAADAERYRLLYLTLQRENERLRQQVRDLEEDLELMLEMEELEQQRLQAQRRRAAQEARDPQPLVEEIEPEAAPRPLPAIREETPPDLSPNRPVRRRSPNDPVLRR